MTVELHTVNEDLEPCWVTANICEQWIGAAWRVDGADNEVNLIIAGFQITVRETEQLRKYLEKL